MASDLDGPVILPSLSNDGAKGRSRLALAVSLVFAVSCSPAGGKAAGTAGDGAGGAGQGPGGTGGTAVFVEPGPTLGESCAKAAYERTLLPSNLLFVVDRSGSMNCNLPPITDSVTCESTATTADPSKPTKWSVIGSAMSSVFDELTTVPSTSVGLTFFSSDDVCGVQSTPNVGLAPLGAAHVTALKSALSTVTPRGGTPLIGATVLGYRHLHQEAQAEGNRFIVLVTDGADSCFSQYAAAGVTGDPVSQLLNVEIPKALSVNIRTFVIGAPGSEPARGLLSKIAFAGGTARDPSCDHSGNPAPGAECHFDMTRSADFATDLSAALRGVAGKAAMTCEFDVPSGQDGGAIDFNTVNVNYYVGGNQTDPASLVRVYRDDTRPCESGADGWQYNTDKTQIRVCGPTCDRIRSDAAAEVVVSLGCEQLIR